MLSTATTSYFIEGTAVLVEAMLSLRGPLRAYFLHITTGDIGDMTSCLSEHAGTVA
jgi:hypothetical protein